MTTRTPPPLPHPPAPRQEGRSTERPPRRDTTALSTPELMTVVLRAGRTDAQTLGLATRLLEACGGLRGLAAADAGELIAAAGAGLGPARAARLAAALELGHCLLRERGPEGVVVCGPADVADLLMGEMALLPQEVLYTVLLDTRGRVLGTPLIHQGSLDTVSVRMAEIFREGIRRNCRSLIAVHNHPSGHPDPSPEDIALTRDMVAAGALLGITVLDHVIIGHGRFASLRARGLGFD